MSRSFGLSRLLLSFLFLLGSLTPLSAQLFSPSLGLSLGAQAGTFGYGLSGALRLTKYMTFRGGFSYLPARKVSSSSLMFPVPEGIDKRMPDFVRLQRNYTTKGAMGHFFVDLSPFPHGWLYLTTGFYMGGLESEGEGVLMMPSSSSSFSSVLKEYGQTVSDYLFSIDSFSFRPSPLGGISGRMVFSQRFRPYLGVGIGRGVALRGRLSMQVDLGALYLGRPNFSSTNDSQGDAREFLRDFEGYLQMGRLSDWQGLLSLRASYRIF